MAFRLLFDIMSPLYLETGIHCWFATSTLCLVLQEKVGKKFLKKHWGGEELVAVDNFEFVAEMMSVSG